MTFTFVPPTEAPCVIAQLGSLALDQVTPDANSVCWGIELLEGWWDTAPARIEQTEIPTGATITVARAQARAIVLTGFAFLPTAALGNLAFAAMKHLKAVVRPSLFTPIQLTVIDPANTLAAQVRLAGEIKSQIVGALQVVRFQVPLTAPNPVLGAP